MTTDQNEGHQILFQSKKNPVFQRCPDLPKRVAQFLQSKSLWFCSGVEEPIHILKGLTGLFLPISRKFCPFPMEGLRPLKSHFICRTRAI